MSEKKDPFAVTTGMIAEAEAIRQALMREKESWVTEQLDPAITRVDQYSNACTAMRRLHGHLGKIKDYHIKIIDDHIKEIKDDHITKMYAIIDPFIAS